MNRALIAWVDEDAPFEVYFCEDEWDENRTIYHGIPDEFIFFYGLTRDQLIDLEKTHEPVEGEWYGVKVL